jgi:hypothetical protein
MRGLGQRGEYVGGLVHPVPQFTGVGKHLAQRAQNPSAPSLMARVGTRMPQQAQPTQQVRPGAGRLAASGGKGDQFLGAISADSDDDQ